MSNSTLRVALIAPLVLLLGLGVWAVVQRYDWLDQHSAAGVSIVGLCFSAMAIFGIYAQLGADFDEADPPRALVRRYLVYVRWMALFLPTFAGGMWLLLVAVTGLLAPLLPGWLRGLIFLIAFTWYIAGVIWILKWLIDRGLLGNGSSGTTTDERGV